MQSPQQVLDAFQEAFAEGKKKFLATGAWEWEPVEAFLSDDCVIYEADGLPHAGAYRGRSSLREVSAKIRGSWKDLKVEEVVAWQVIAEDAEVQEREGVMLFGLVEFSATSIATGKSFSMPVADIYRVKDGLIREMRPIYYDTKLLADIA